MLLMAQPIPAIVLPTQLKTLQQTAHGLKHGAHGGGQTGAQTGAHIGGGGGGIICCAYGCGAWALGALEDPLAEPVSGTANNITAKATAAVNFIIITLLDDN
jgi:hypothetical protein